MLCLVFPGILCILYAAECTCTRSKSITFNQVVDFNKLYLLGRYNVGYWPCVVTKYRWLNLCAGGSNNLLLRFSRGKESFLLANPQVQFFIDFVEKCLPFDAEMQ